MTFFVILMLVFTLHQSLSLTSVRMKNTKVSNSFAFMHKQDGLSGGNDVSMITECDLSTEGTVECNHVPTKTDTLSLSKSVWTTFGELASATGSSNLGQGFPDWTPPQFVRDALRDTVDSTFHQYTRPAGHPPLVKLLAERYSTHMNRPVNPFDEVAVTVGASQSLYLALRIFLKAEDEVVIFEPFFDLYLKQVNLVGATTRFVQLGGDAATLEDPWAVDIPSLRRAITPKTKVIILNSPHNPTGKVFTMKELEAVAQIVRENPNIIVLCDEVYKFTIYNPFEIGDPSVRGHYHFARLPGMWDRTITISSCGKTFSVTGWQVGWMVGPEKFIKPVQELLPCVQFCAATIMQQALTNALKVADEPYDGYFNYYEWLRSQFSKKRSILEEGLRAAGIEPLAAQGGFFIMGKLPLGLSDEILGSQHFRDEPYDWRFCRYLVNEYKVAAIPASSFFSENSPSARRVGPTARFAFCKKDRTMLEAASRLKKKY